MFCQKCGTDIGDAKFCPKCGEKASGDGEPCYVPPENCEKMVNKIAYGLLAIFLGWLGVHRFYAGKVLSGVAYLVLDLLIIGLFFIPILNLIEGIIALCREDDGHGNIPVYKDKFFV